MLEQNGLPSAGGKAIPILYRAVGCNACSGSGYKGRVAIVEVLKVSDEIRRLTVERYPAEDIKKYAIAEGMRTLREDGMRKALSGITSIEEVLRVVV
jgi:type IV pilus assembly protein PilB